MIVSDQPRSGSAEARAPGASDYFYIDAFDDDRMAATIRGPMPEAKNATVGAPRGTPAYLAHLWNTPLLTEEQEYHYFRKLNFLKHLSSTHKQLADSGLHCSERPATGTPTTGIPATETSEEVQYLDELQHSNENHRIDEETLQLRNQIVESNLRLVVSLAKNYARFGSNEFDDLVCIGNAALMRAVDLFDFRRGLRFSTYAHRAVQCAMYSEYRKEGRVQRRFVSCGNAATESAIADAGESDMAELQASEAREQVIGLMEALDDRDQQIVMERFGINRKHNGVAFHVIAKQIGLSTTRTVQLFHRSILRMQDRLKKKRLTPAL